MLISNVRLKVRYILFLVVLILNDNVRSFVKCGHVTWCLGGVVCSVYIMFIKLLSCFFETCSSLTLFIIIV